MTHQQLFRKADNADGYITCIVLRERYLEEFEKLGFCQTVEEALAQPAADTKRQPLSRSRKEADGE